ncbi:polyketide synthase [Aspergillus fijiensis CBS 313.89]|uniref:Polyketide synthase n=1 Tax=Aspergillus fijiensis CBS 313.89 TaxID=1448319 RepID=A0A8G1W3V5_9EURO|nr:polyketide synthase [Aspergillus fijiensis CBS 313.89]RAK81976.1 polyketide synthase [Aspergillus fijiensis CBS 313.89]
MTESSTFATAPAAPEPIAVIGMGCRFAGEASSIEGFWDMLRLGRKEHGRVPSNRYQASAWKHPSHERAGAINHDSGFFLKEDPGYFDAPFFAITAKEAAGMDPVQRLLLEVAYEAFENGGVPMESLPGSATGVYSGCMTNDYELLSTRDIMDMPHNSATGNGRTMLANRLSWFFDLRGPSIMLDTACSSSLNALHLATQALRAGECSQALVTGASLILHPNFTQRLSYMHMLSADGISHSFDSRANGYGRGEGFGAVLLKPLSKAQADGDVIRAIVRATGSNQDGRTPGITMPNAEAQADLIRATYRQARLSPSDVTYFEAHGTGTAIGDPTELSALGSFFGPGDQQPRNEPVYVGSVKSNVGHTEGAAGVASLIKVILCLEKAMLVPNAGFSQLNPKIRSDEWGLRLSDSTTPWPAHRPQRASINSFGFGGANAHAILESAAQYLGSGSAQRASATVAKGTPQVVVVSTHDKAGLDRTAEKWTTYLDDHVLGKKTESLALPDVAHTMATRRSQLAFRSYAVVNSLEELRETMSAGLPSFPRASRKTQTSLAFVCTGQGAQWARMGVELLAHPVFATSVDRSQQLLQTMGCTWDLLEEIRADATATRVNRPDRSQPICCALQVALIDLLRSWKVSPKAVIGHSSGEVGAAYAAGYLTHEDAIRITYFRGVYSQQIAENGRRRGGMLAAGISADQGREYLRKLPPDSVVVACVNSPSSVTLSGNIEEIKQLEKQLQTDGHFARKLRVDTAYHSPHMRELASQYEEAIQSVQPVDQYKGSVAMFSSVTKERVRADDLNASYWVRNLVSPVEFAAAATKLATMTEAGKGRRRAVPVKWGGFLEIGPHEALKGPFMQTLQEANKGLTSLPYTGLVRRKEDALRVALQAAGLLWSIGYGIDIDAANRSLLPEPPRVSLELPAYAWNHQSTFWHEPLESARLRQRAEPRHDLLGVPFDYQNELEPRWRNFIRVSDLPWVADHVVAGSIVYPAAGMVAMVAEAGRQLADSKKWLEGIEFHDLEFFRGVVIPADERGLETTVHVAPHRGVPGWYEFGIFSLPENSSWVQHAKGSFALQYADDGDKNDTQTTYRADWQSMVEGVRQTQKVAKKTDIEHVYKWLGETGGVTLGPTFHSMVGVSFDPKSPRLHVSGVVPDTQRTMPHECESPCFVHPTSLDALFQAAVLSCSEALTNHKANIPIAVERLYLSTGFSLQPGDHFEVHVETRYENGVSLSESIASDPSWQQPGVVLQGVRLGRVPMQSRSSSGTGSEEVAGSRFSSLTWAEHVDSGCHRPNEVVKCAGGLPRWVERLCHTRGDAKALVVAEKDNTEEIVQALQSFAPGNSQRPRLQQLTAVLIHPNPEELEGQLKSLQSALPGCQSLVVSSLQELDADLVGDDYDVVLTDYARGQDDGNESETLLSSLGSLTGPDSWIIARTSTEDAVVSHVEAHPDWALRGSLEQPHCSIIRRESSALEPGPVIYVLRAGPTETAAALSHELKDIFESTGARIEPVSIDKVSELEGKIVISLLELDQPWTMNWTEDEMDQFRGLLKAKCLLWVSSQGPADEALRSASSGATTGLLRTLRNERSGLALPQLFVADSDKEAAPLAQSIAHVLQLTLQPSGSRSRDWEYYVQDGQLFVPRALAATSLDESMDALLNGPRPTPAELVNDRRPMRLRTESPDLQDAHWVEDERINTPLSDDHVEVQLHQVTIFPTVGKKKTLLPEAGIRAVEAVGVIRQVGASISSAFAPGEPVLCIVPSDAWSSSMATREHAHQSVSMPVAYATAYTSLLGSSGSPAASSVLVVGSVSQTLRATIDCALAAGMQVYAAVEGESAAAELRSRYPALKKDRIIALHRDLPTTISRLTAGKGVELSVCGMGGVATRLAAQCLSFNGRLVDLSGELNLACLPQSVADRGCTVSSLRLSRLLRDAPRQLQASFHRAVDLLAGGKDRAVARIESYPVFPVSQLTDALAHARDLGTRVIINLQAPGKVPIVPAIPEPAPLRAENTYLLIGGLGTLGLSLATTLADCGARHIVFVSRSGAVQPTQTAALEGLQAQGVRTEVVRCDAARREDVQGLLAQAKEHNWRIRGIVQCATVLKDGMFEQMKFDDWKQSISPKIQGTWNLHEAFSDPNRSNGDGGLDFFVTLSSVASVIGNMGQANYSAGNGYMDALMRWRQQHGLPGHSINIGLVPDASGVGEALAEESPEQRRQRYRHLEGTEVLQHEIQTLFRVIVQGISEVPAQVIAGMTDILPRGEDGASASPWQFDRKFDHRARLAAPDAQDGVDGGAGVARKPSVLLKKAESVDEAVRVVQQALQEYLARAMAAAPDDIDLELPFSALGVDSLKAAEVQSWVNREMGAEVSSFEFLGSQPVRTLAEKIAAGSSFVSASA